MPTLEIHNRGIARLQLLTVIVVAVLAIAFALRMIPRMRNSAQLNAQAQQAANTPPTVRVVSVQRADPKVELALPGNSQAIQDTSVYARANGYIKRYLVDIGDKVQANQLLAEIDTPELDQELSQGRANLNQAHARLGVAQANLGVAEADYKRFKDIANTGAVTLAEMDLKKATQDANQAQVEAANADVAANEANVHRLTDLQSFKQVVAPFAGVITARSAQVGLLVSAGTANELFHIADTTVLRVFVNVPQSLSASVKEGQHADVRVREYPNRVFRGFVSRTAGAVDTSTRTLRTEVEIPNPDGALLPGMYSEVRFFLNRIEPPMVIPAAGLIVRANGTLVALIRPDNTIHYQKVSVARDLGRQIEISSGLNEGDLVGMNISEELLEGAKVNVTKDFPPGTGPANQLDPQNRERPIRILWDSRSLDLRV